MCWPLLNMYSENFGLGPGGFHFWGYLYKSEEVIIHIHIPIRKHVRMCFIHTYIYIYIMRKHVCMYHIGITVGYGIWLQFNTSLAPRGTAPTKTPQCSLSLARGWRAPNLQSAGSRRWSPGQPACCSGIQFKLPYLWKYRFFRLIYTCFYQMIEFLLDYGNLKIEFLMPRPTVVPGVLNGLCYSLPP